MQKIIIRFDLGTDGASFLTEVPFDTEEQAHEYMRAWTERCTKLGLRPVPYTLTYWTK